MQDDLAALKKGETPAGFKIEKESEKEVKPVTSETQKGQEAQKISTPLPISHVELGKLEKTRPITAETPPLRQAGLGVGQAQKGVPPGLSKLSISIPSVGGFLGRFKGRPDFKRIVFYVIASLAGFIITAFLVPYFTSLPTTSVSPTPTATPTRTPTATPISIENLFSTVDTFGISLGPDFTTRFINPVRTGPLLSSREPGIYKITSIDGINQYGFSEFFSGVSIVVPDELKPLIDDNGFWLSLTYKSDNTVSFGFIVKLLNPDAINDTLSVMQNWESAMTQALTNLFKFDPTKAASVGFLDNTYNGTAVRYKNFPDPGLTIDYSVIQAKNGESYLIMVNSREHIYKIIDKLK